MKTVTFKRKNNAKRNKKVLSIIQQTEDDKSKTQVRKSFMYFVKPASGTENAVQSPNVYIRKNVDNAKKVEKFNFQVKGVFYITHNRQLLEVEFHHSLNILIRWKPEHFSPKKSEMITD
ncbi:MAG: hypothetical protein KC713_10255 [Candidatus Omnitrophica bacterium]|nr:hypothetical protein [Candidatus Omnitrophota bacterium]